LKRLQVAGASRVTGYMHFVRFRVIIPSLFVGTNNDSPLQMKTNPQPSTGRSPF
jgi:hypothetical protein